jgi:aryl-alcohol dehydrogenase-like predicted oxidoreductase/enamine deaminase RidA (YjgF/YER057c/UK114 family)
MSTLAIDRCELAPGFSISRIVTGLWQIADMERDGTRVDVPKAAEQMAQYVEAGLTTFDMADHYGSAEDIAGEYCRRYGASNVQVLTKWVPKPGRIAREDVRGAVQRSLDRLHVERIDLMQFHAWNYADPVWLDCLFWLQELKGDGLIRCIGLTNFDTAHLRIALHSGIDIVSNQVCFSLLDRRAAGAMTALCLQHGVKLLAYGTLAGGLLTDRWLGKPEPADMSTWPQMKYRRFIEAAGGWNVFQEVLEAVHEAARKHNVSMANIASRFVLGQQAVAGVIIGAGLGRSEHIAGNARLFSFDLNEESRATIRATLARLTPIPGDCGDEYRRPPYLTASGDLSHHLDTMPPPYTARPAQNGRVRVLSGTEWETIGGFCRAMRTGDRITVSGTTATHGTHAIGGADVAAQTHFIIDKIEGALQSLGSSLEDVVRTRIYVRNIADWEAAARAHGERFRDILPANTLVQARLVGDEYLVEMEAEAVVARRTSLH